ncbi:MAG TPA: hypothetical protein VF219_07660 [Vicinamibacterales bacterium]
MRDLIKRHEEVDVAVRTELGGAQNGSEQTQFGDPPFSAERLNGIAV